MLTAILQIIVHTQDKVDYVYIYKQQKLHNILPANFLSEYLRKSKQQSLYVTYTIRYMHNTVAKFYIIIIPTPDRGYACAAFEPFANGTSKSRLSKYIPEHRENRRYLPFTDIIKHIPLQLPCELTTTFRYVSSAFLNTI